MCQAPHQNLENGSRSRHRARRSPQVSPWDPFSPSPGSQVLPPVAEEETGFESMEAQVGFTVQKQQSDSKPWCSPPELGLVPQLCARSMAISSWVCSDVAWEGGPGSQGIGPQGRPYSWWPSRSWAFFHVSGPRLAPRQESWPLAPAVDSVASPPFDTKSMLGAFLLCVREWTAGWKRYMWELVVSGASPAPKTRSRAFTGNLGQLGYLGFRET